jgi:hypothetical protein
MKKLILACVLASGVAIACDNIIPRLVVPGVVEVGLTSSLADQYTAIRNHVVSQVGNSVDDAQVVAVTVNITRSFMGIGRSTTVNFSKHCTESLYDALDAFRIQFMQANEVGGSGGGNPEIGGIGGGGSPMADCILIPGRTGSTDVGGGEKAYFTSPDQLVCPV